MRTRGRYVDPVGVLLAGCSVLVFLLHGFVGRLTPDVSVYAYSGQQVAEGVPPYEEILNRAGPLAHLVPGAGAYVGDLLGVDDLLTMRVTLMVVSVLAVWAAYVLGRDLYDSRPAGAVAAVCLLSFQGFITYATYGPREKTTMVLFMLLALAAISRGRWATAGAMTALATLTWQGAFLPLAVGALLAIGPMRGLRPRVSALLRWAAAGIGLAAVTVVYFAAVGALPAFWEGFYAVNAGWTSQSGLLETLLPLRRLMHGFGWTVALLVIGLVGCLVVAAVRLPRLDRDSPRDLARLAVAGGAVTCMLWALYAFQGWPDAFFALPYAVCGVAGLTHLLTSRLPRRVALVSTVGLVATALVVAGAWSTMSRDAELKAQQRQLDAVLDVLPGHVEILALGSPEPLVLSDQRNPIRYQIFGGGQAAYLRDTYPGGLAGLAAHIRAQEPTVVTVRGMHESEWVHDLLSGDYQRVAGQRNRYVVFASLERTTPEQRAAMKRAAMEPGGLSTQTGSMWRLTT